MSPEHMTSGIIHNSCWRLHVHPSKTSEGREMTNSSFQRRGMNRKLHVNRKVRQEGAWRKVEREG